ncbi:DUF2141 domain-containing protein [Armatimonas sp.]|uniref:DUF2141 domain-containing protein n=1 Tax=Armatimonas sp. TaxID=1872638 RepID=UPI00286A0085|nr:DUF2141 domain-containing protein [Armatimonas sp.]
MQNGTRLVELSGEELALKLMLPEKFDPGVAWPLRMEGADTKALVLNAAPAFREKALIWVKQRYPIALAEGEKPQETTLTVEVSGMRSTKGQMVYSLFSGPEGFPDKGEKAVASGQCVISPEKTAHFTIPKLAPGSYAVTLFHDENGNAKLDAKAFGIPKEGFGFSRDPKIRIGPPRFKDTAFAITGAGSERTITIKLVHL